MIILLPMNGKGQRFKDAGFNIPKPLLPLGKEAVLKKVEKTYKNIDWESHLLISRDLAKSFGFKEYFPVPVETSGPLETILCSLGNDSFGFDSKILIADCDSFFEHPQELYNSVGEFSKSDCIGGVTYRRTSDPECSYFTLKDGLASDFREKDPYTLTSSTGPYYWKSWSVFYQAALKAYWNHETSIAPVYNYAEGNVRAVEVKTFVHLGTPDAYLNYCRSHV